MPGWGGEPGFIEVGVYHFEEGPHRPFRAAEGRLRDRCSTTTTGRHRPRSPGRGSPRLRIRRLHFPSGTRRARILVGPANARRRVTGPRESRPASRLRGAIAVTHPAPRLGRRPARICGCTAHRKPRGSGLTGSLRTRLPDKATSVQRDRKLPAEPDSTKGARHHPWGRIGSF